MRIALNLPKLAFCLCALALGLVGGIVRAQTLTLSGTVTDSTTGTVDGEIAVSGVSVKAVSAFGTNGPAVTSATGVYTISNLSAFFYTVTPSKTGLTFSPADQVVDLTSSMFAVDFSVAHSVSGDVSFNGTGLNGTTVTVDGFSATTGTNGNYTVNGVPWGTFAVVPSLSGYFFVPPSQNVPLGPNATNINFTAYENGIYIGGQVTNGTNGVSGVTVMAGPNLTTTGVNGYYSFSNLPGVFLVTPSNAAQVFNPQHQTLTATVGLTNINFAQGVSNITTIVATLDEPSLAAAVNFGGLVEFGSNGDLLLTNTLNITNNVVLNGTNHQATFGGAGLEIGGSNIVVGLNNLVFSNEVEEAGGAVSIGGNPGEAVVNISQCLFVTNFGNSGGAIYNDYGGVANISGCLFVSNYSDFGGAIYNDFEAVANISGCTFVGNYSYEGGGAIFNNQTLTVTNSTFLQNSNSTELGAYYGGGAIDSYRGSATIIGSTFASNVTYGCCGTDGSGGAIRNDTDAVLVNCTFANNFVTGETNGGEALFNASFNASTSMALTNCTFETSSATNPVVYFLSGLMTIRASIFNGDAVGSGFIDAGFNLCTAAGVFTNNTSKNGVSNLYLSSVLASNGGPTMTFNLMPGSPCIDAITNGSYPVTDQRGFTRPYGKAADSGAVEYYPSNFTINSLTGKNTNWTVAGYGFPLTAFQLLSSTNLTKSSWSVVQTNVTGSNGLFSILDTSSNVPCRFYRTAVP